jgi:hypothetical protein
MDKKERLKGLLKSVDAVIAAMRVSVTSAQGEYANLGNYSSYKTFMQKYEALALEARPWLPETKLLTFYDLSKVKSSGNLTWSQQKEIFRSHIHQPQSTEVLDRKRNRFRR